MKLEPLTPEQLQEVARVVQSLDALGEWLASQGHATRCGQAQIGRAMVRWLAQRQMPVEKPGKKEGR